MMGLVVWFNALHRAWARPPETGGEGLSEMTMGSQVETRVSNGVISSNSTQALGENELLHAIFIRLESMEAMPHTEVHQRAGPACSSMLPSDQPASFLVSSIVALQCGTYGFRAAWFFLFGEWDWSFQFSSLWVLNQLVLCRVRNKLSQLPILA